MNRSLRTTALSLASLGLVAGLGACSSDPSTADANAAFCDANATVQAEVSSLKSLVLSGDATRESLSEQVDQIKSAASSSDAQASTLADSVRDDVEAANEAFSAAVEAIPSDASLTEAAAAYRSALADWESAISQVRTDVGC